MAISKKLGTAIGEASRFKTIKITFEDTTFDLRLRVPVKRELEEMLSQITTPEQELVDRIYTALSAPLLKTLNETDGDFLKVLNAESEKIKLTDDDVIIDGNSVKHIAQVSAIWQTQVQKYFSLLQSSTGEPINETYEEIAEEFPEFVIKEIIEKIESAIRPNYKETKKN
jgi:hypothetical protein